MAGLAGVTLAVMTGSGFVGYQVALHHSDAVSSAQESRMVDRWQQRVQETQSELAALEERADQEIDELTRRLGQLQARLLRVDALGKSLVSSADVGDAEFDFESTPAMGGPEQDAAGESYTVEALDQQIASLDSRLRSREKQLDLLDQLMVNAEIESQREVDGRPVSWGWVSSQYGYRNDPFSGQRSWHSGVDIASEEGRDVIAVGSGVVTEAQDRGGYGYFVEIDHGDGMQTRYAHAKELLVEPGQIVEKGQPIALIGSTGRSTGPHVHFEVLENGTPKDPEDFM